MNAASERECFRTHAFTGCRRRRSVNYSSAVLACRELKNQQFVFHSQIIFRRTRISIRVCLSRYVNRPAAEAAATEWSDAG